MNQYHFLVIFVSLLFICKGNIDVQKAIRTFQNKFTAIPCTDPNCKECWKLNMTQCGSCKDGYVGDKIQNICAACASKISNCTSCTFNSFSDKYECSTCNDQYYPYPSKNNCTNCKSIIDNCIHCITTKKDFTTYISCDQCAQGYEKNGNGICVVPSQPQSNSTIIIIVSVIGGLIILAGIGFGVFKCLKKKNKHSTLLQTND